MRILVADGTDPHTEVLLLPGCRWRWEQILRPTLVILDIRVIAIVVTAIPAQLLIQPSEAVPVHAKEYVAYEERPIFVIPVLQVDGKTKVQAGGDGVGLRDDQYVLAGRNYAARDVEWPHHRFPCRQSLHQLRQRRRLVDGGSHVPVS